MKNRGITKSVLGRSAKLLSMATKLAGQEAAARVRGTETFKLRIDQALAVTTQLRQLKGAVMKAGQLLSIDASDFLPPEAVEILGTLQGDAEPVDFDIVEGVLRDELGDDGFERLESLERVPIAAASIGQVHRATVDGAAVAVKVQYPGVSTSIDSDLKMLEKLASSWLTVTRRRIDLGSLFAELADILHMEADFEQEREHLDEYRNMLSGDDRYVVPTSYPELSSTKVLTMSFEEGQTMRKWLADQPTASNKARVGRALLDLYCVEFFDHGFVQTDPNPANFLARADGRIALLDFGATLRYDEAFREEYRALLRAVAAGDRQQVIDTAISFELLDPRESEETLQLFVDMLQNAVEPFSSGVQPFMFRDKDYLDRARQISTEFTSALEYSPPPRRILFLHRKLGGIFNLLKRMDVRLNLTPYWDQMVAGQRPGLAA